MKKPIKKHYFLITGQIIFVNPENDDNGSIALNTLITSKTGVITAHKLGQAQQSLQLMFHKNVGDEKITILDVVIMNISSLGYMSEAEFQERPVNVQLQEVAPADPFAEMVAANTVD